MPAEPFPSDTGRVGTASDGRGEDSSSSSQTFPSTTSQNTQSGQLSQQARDVKDQARQSATQVIDQAKAGAQQVKEGAQHLKSQVGQQAADAARQLREKGQSLLGEQKTRAAASLEGVGKAIHDAGSRLEREDDNTLASYVHGAADQVQVLADYLKNKQVEDLYQDTCNLARRRPELFVGGMFVAGLLLARFAKSSSPARSHSVSYRPDAARNREYGYADRDYNAADAGYRSSSDSTGYAPPTPATQEVAGMSNNLDTVALRGTADVEPVSTSQQQPRGF